MNNIYKYISGLIIFFFALTAQGQVWIEDFDGSSSSTPATSLQCGGNPDLHYFGVVCLFGGGCSRELSPAWSSSYNNVMGSFLGAYDTDNANGCGGVGSDQEFAEWTGINISSCSEPNNMYLCFDVAHFGNIQASGAGWDPPSNVTFSITIDSGSPITLASIEDQGQNTNPAFDLDCDEVGDAAYAIDNTFTPYCFQIPGFGSNIDVLINIVGLNESFEDIGIDNVGVYCEADPASLPGVVLQGCGSCSPDNDCDGVIVSEDCDDNDASVSIPTASTFNSIPDQCAGGTDPLPGTSIEGFTGSWLPVFDPNTTTTYTFTPDANQCAMDGMLTVTIDAETASTFNSIPSQCAGGTDPLPAMSIENFTGSWTPVFDPNTTTVYTFIPDANQCATGGMLTVTIDAETASTFNSIPSQCEGETDPLPAMSIEGFTGSWTPVFDPNTTTVYTFIPDANQCATGGMVTVTIDAETASTFNAIPSQCAGEADPLPIMSIEGFTGSWTPVFNANTTTTYTFTTDANQCAMDGMVTVTIDAETASTFNTIPSQCEGGIDPLPTTSTEGFTGSWTPVFNANTTTTYTFTPDANQCASAGMVTVTIDAETASTFNTIPSQCEGGIDPLPTTSTEGFTGSWTPVFNSNTTTTYTFTPDANQCASNGMVTVNIDQQILPSFSQLGPYCVGDTPDVLPLTSVNGISGAWDGPIITSSPGSITYTFIPGASECAMNATMQIEVNDCGCANPAGITIDPILPICENETIVLTANISGSANMVTWSTSGDGGFDNTTSITPTYTPGANDILNGSVTLTATTDDPDGTGPCLEASTNVVLMISTQVLPQFTQLGPYCIDDTPDALPLTSVNGISGTWDGPIITSSPGSSTYTFIPNTTECAVTATMQIEIIDCGCANPALITIDPILPICENETIELTANISGSASMVIWSSDGDGGFDNATFTTSTYTPGVNDITNGSVTLTATTDDPDGTGPCLEASANVVLMINAQVLPQFDQLGPYCIDDTPDVLPLTSVNGISGTWDGPISTSSAGSITYNFMPGTGECAMAATMQIEVNDCGCADLAIVTIDPVLPICENETIELTANISGSASTVIWSSNGDGGFDNTISITPIYTPGINDIASGSVTLTATTDDPDGSGPCLEAIANVVLMINAQELPEFTQLGSYCVDDIPDVFPLTSMNGISGTWDGPIITSSPGSNTYTFTPDNGECAMNTTMQIEIDDCGCADPALITLEAILPICENETIALTANISGSASLVTWSSAGDGSFDDMASITPTYTPGVNDIANGSVILTAITDDPDGAGPCSEANANVSLIINGEVIPQFTQLGSYCIDDSPNILPLTSLNGINGTWDGAITTSSAGSSMYTFTPDSEECAISTTMQIEVNDCGCVDLAMVTIDPILPICENETIALTANISGSASIVTWSSAGDGSYDNNTSSTPIYSPSVNDIASGSVTLTATTDDPDGSGPCMEASTNVVLMINAQELPQFTQLGSYCVDETPGVLPLISTNGISGTWDGPIITSSPGSSTYTFTPDNDECATSTTMQIEVNDCGCADPALITVDPILPICENETIALTANISGSASMVTWSSTGDGSFDNTTSITPMYTPGINDLASSSVTLIATTDDPDGTGPCLEASTNVVLMISIQELPQFAQLGPYCVDDTPDALPLTSTNGISGTWNGPIVTSSSGATMYTFTPVSGECALNTTMQIEVNDCGCADPALITIDAVLPICEDETIELTANISGSASMVTWSSTGDGSFDDNTSSTPTYAPGTNDIAGGSVTLTATTDDPDGSGPCLEASANATLIINEEELPQFAQLGPYCVDETPDDLPLTSINGISGTWDGPIVTSSLGSSTYTFTPDLDECAEFLILTVVVENCDCGGAQTISIPCDDDNTCTTDDVSIVLASDSTVCVPCQGTVTEVLEDEDDKSISQQLSSFDETFTVPASDLYENWMMYEGLYIDGLNLPSGFDAEIDTTTGVLTIIYESGLEGEFDFSVEICNDMCGISCFSISLSLDFKGNCLDVESLSFPSGFTPNGDGVNDVYRISGYTECQGEYQSSELIIWNRWGNVVFSESPYQNDWDGTDQSGKSLPEGTYYYSAVFDSSNGVISNGYIVILR